MKTSRIIVTTLAMASLTLAGIAGADEITKEGYLIDSRGDVVKSGTGLCWHTGYWTPAMAIMECDPDLVKKPVTRITTVPPVPPIPGRVHAPVTLQTEALFDVDSSVIRADGKKKLDDEVVGKMKEYPQDEVVLLTGHADRIGSEAYNQNLSQRRADAVRAYMIDQGIEAKRIQTAAKGESEPIVSCDNVKGMVNSKNRKLVVCLQPNRRVVVDVKAQK